PVIEWDFRNGLENWEGHFITTPTKSAEGITFKPTSFEWTYDPIKLGGSVISPSIKLPSDQYVRVVIRMKSTAGKACNLYYYFGDEFLEHQNEAVILNNDGQFHDYQMFIQDPPGEDSHFMILPSDATEAEITLQSIKVERMTPHSVPYARPVVPNGSDPRIITSGALEIHHYGERLGNFQVKYSNTDMAVGYQSEVLGLKNGSSVKWINLETKPAFINKGAGSDFTITSSFEGDGANWTIERNFYTESNGCISVTSSFCVDKDREVILVPWLTLYAGLGSFGGQKNQAVLPGLEYLSSRDSSSNMKAITTVEHKRRIPDPVKLTIPLMAITQNEHYVGLIWEQNEMTNALFDSPDRLTDTESHLMGVTGPAVGSNRVENELAAHFPVVFKAGEIYSTTMTMIGGKG
ncbi:MAG: hypothetical protein KAT15_20980, partial [Bacteroidales bacterium]|nr:hypothetical protein [Bacteroidales bacterium]